EALLQKAIRLDPDNPKPRQFLARLYYIQDRKADAEQVMVQAKKDLGAKDNMYRVLGDYYITVGDLDKAISEFAALSKQHPKDLSVREDYIDLLLRKNRVEEARKLTDEILVANPKNTGAQMLRGRIQSLSGQYPEAINTLQAALKDAPDY